MDINSRTPKQALFISPLLGGLFSSIVLIIYFFVLILATTNDITVSSASFWFATAWNLITYLPLILSIFILISYLCSMTIGVLLFKIKQYYFLSSGVFWLLAWMSGSVIGINLSIVNYYFENNLGKAFVITICFSLGAVFNASLFSVLTGDISTKYKFKK